MPLRKRFWETLADGLKQETREESLPDDWEDWLNEMFPKTVYHGFADHHAEFWEWAWKIGTPEQDPMQNILFALARGGGKSTTAEAAAVALTVTGKKKVVAYVCGTTSQANDHLSSIKRKLESDNVKEFFPLHAKPRLYEHTKGSWSQSRVATDGGAYFVAFGLDGGKRGFKDDDLRPDLIIVDDVDTRTQSAATVLRKLDMLTSDILPMGSEQAHVMFIQNPIHADSVMDQIITRKSDMMGYRKEIGPVPALLDAEFAQELDENGKLRYFVTRGTPTWKGQGITHCQNAIDTWGYTTFLREAQHDIHNITGGMYGHVEFQLVDWSEALMKSLVRTTVWIDPSISETKKSDSMGIQADGIDEKGDIYRLWSWEQIASPEEAFRRGLIKAVEIGAQSFGVETDQGGLAWKSVYKRAWDHLVKNDLIPKGSRRPAYKYAKGGGDGSKGHRSGKMLVDYEHGRIFHVRGTHELLERAARRFLVLKPYDLMDAAYWSWKHLRRTTFESDGETVTY